MNEDGIDYHELPPYVAQGVVLPIYMLVDGIYKMAPQLSESRPFVEENAKLRERMKVEDPEIGFRMNYLECVVLCQTMSVIKLYYQNVVVPNTEGKENLLEFEVESRRMFDELMEQVVDISDNIFIVFPLIKEPFYEAEIKEKKKKDEEKTLGLDKTKKILYIGLSNELVAHHIIALFSFFDYFIIKGIFDFSERVRESPFCCITEVKEVKEIFENAMRLTKRNKKRQTKLTLRDVVVLLMVNNIFQKAFFSDGGDELHNFFAHCVDDIDGLAVEEIRNHLLKTAKGLEEEICKLINDRAGFKEAMQPIFDFPV
jgi:hypothetical protein